MNLVAVFALFGQVLESLCIFVDGLLWIWAEACFNLHTRPQSPASLQARWSSSRIASFSPQELVVFGLHFVLLVLVFVVCWATAKLNFQRKGSERVK